MKNIKKYNNKKMDINELEMNINQAISKKVIFDMNSERAKKRLAQMQKRKDYLNETDSIKNDKSTISLNETSIQIEESTPTQFSNKNNNPNTDLNQNNINNNQNSNNILLNPFSFDETEKSENEISNIELNVSDLDCNIEIDENDNKLKELNNVSSSEYAKNFCTSTSKSFVHLNNNLVARAAAQNEKNTTSYLLALCPEILKKNNNNKEVIFENYAVDDAINEENEVETPNKGNKTFLNSDNNHKKKYNFKKNFNNCNFDCKKNNGKDLKNDTFNNLLFNNVNHKKSKSGISFNNILKNHSAENKKSILKKKIQNSGNNKNTNNNYKKIFFDNIKSPLNKSKLSKNKPSSKINSSREFEHLKKNLIKHIPFPYSKKTINPLSKRIKISNSNKSNSIILYHNKSKTSFTKPFFVKINTPNTLRNNYSSSRVTENNQIKYKINEIKKDYKNSYHKKNKTYGSKLPIDNNQQTNNYYPNNNNYQNKNFNGNNSIHINNNLNRSYKKNLKNNKSFSKLEISNKNKIISSLKKMNFFSNENYSKALLALNNSTSSLFTILVFYDSNTNKFSFRGLYEINNKDSNVSANKIFSSSFCQSKININEINHFYTYDVKKEFVKFNFQNNENKKFNYNTILIF